MRKVAMWRPPIWGVALVMCCSLSFGAGLGFVRGQEDQTGSCTEAKDVCAKFSEFWHVWNLAEKNFVDPKAINSDAMTAGAINGMLDSLGDQGHTRFMTAKQVQREQEQLKGSFEGIGAYVNTLGSVPVIVAPIEGSPAEAAGVKSGDLILKVNGKATEGMILDDVVSMIRGPEGTSVTITVRHVGEEGTVDIPIVRAAVTVPSTSFTMLPGKIAFIKLNQFTENATKDLEGRLNEAKAAGARGLIFDVRDNPGGIRDQAVSVTSLFVAKGQVVLREENRDKPEDLYRSENAHPELQLPMVVLINGGSASSSEIFAGALQDYGRATLIGVPTFGTGTVLRSFQLQDGSAVLMGVSQWQTPKGRYLRREGVTPDLQVALPYGVEPVSPRDAKSLSEAEILNTKDIQLQRALLLLGAIPRDGAAPSPFYAR